MLLQIRRDLERYFLALANFIFISVSTPNEAIPNFHSSFLSHHITMTNKRTSNQVQDRESALRSKRSRLNDTDGTDDLPTSSQSRIDPTYGQRGAFPGLDDFPNDDGLFYGPASDGLEYLRMVR